MPWIRLANAASDLSPALSGARERLIAKISDALTGSSTLDRIEIAVRAGRRGWAATGLGIAIDPEDEELDPSRGADDLIEMARGHAEDHGEALYLVSLLGESKRNEPRELGKVQLDLREGGDGAMETTRDVAAGDLLATSANMADAYVRHNTTLLKAISGFVEKVEGCLNMAAEQGKCLVEMRKLEYEHAERREDRAFDAAEAEARDTLIRDGMRTAWPAVKDLLRGWAMSGAWSSASPPAGAGIAGELEALLASLDDPERVHLETLLGTDVWDLLTAASKAGGDDECKAILAKIREAWAKMTKAEGAKLLTDVAMVLKPERASKLMEILKRSGV